MDATRRDFLYVASGAMGAVGVAAAAWPFIDQMNPSAAVLALASIEVDLTTIQPGRFNAVGAGVSVFFLAVAVNGMNLLGAQTYVQQLFYGVFLVIAVVGSRVINRRRAASAAKAAT